MKKSILTFISLFCIILSASAQKIFVLPIEDEIDARAWQHTRRACAEAVDAKADLFVVKLNTYGGALDSADSIRSALLRLPIPTAAYVDHNAASAGALIALACDSVFMTPGSSMGAATVVDQNGQPMPDKYQAYMSSIMRSTAERHGKHYSETDSSWHWRRDPAVAAGMVNPDKVVSFTASEALDAHFSDATVTSFHEMLTKLNVANPKIDTFNPTFTDEIIGFLSSTAVRAILIMLIIGGIYMEMHTPGLGFAAAVAAVATCLYFLPMFISGTLPAWIVMMLIIGIVLFTLEIFVIPGFGICGIAGLAAILIALCAAIIPPAANDTAYSLTALTKPIVTVVIGLIGAIGLIAWLTSRHGPKFIRRHTELMLTQDVKDGYIGVDMSPAEFIGHKAVALTDMRPAGKIKLGNQIYDAVSTGEFIDAGSHVRITKYENAQLYVEPTNITI